MLSTDKIKKQLSTEDIIKLCVALQGSDEYYFDTHGNPIFNTILDHPGGDSFKLYLLKDTQLFHCFTGNADTYDVFEMVCRARQCSFREAYDYIVEFFHLNRFRNGFEEEETPPLGEWDIFQKVEDYEKFASTTTKPNAEVAENMLEYFYPLAAPEEWIREGISPEVMLKYGIRIDSALSKIIIPHRDINGKLVGIRGRAFDPNELLDGKKYMPVYIEGKLYNHKLGTNLYGLYENQENIRRIRRVLVYEGEKSVLQAATFYGSDSCWAVATCGSSFSKEQMNLLLDLGVEEIIIGYDREFKGVRGEPDVIAYEDKLLKIAEPLLPYVNVSVIMDYDHKTQYKDSPTDRGREIFEDLYRNRVRLSMPDNIISRRRKRR